MVLYQQVHYETVKTVSAVWIKYFMWHFGPGMRNKVNIREANSAYIGDKHFSSTFQQFFFWNILKIWVYINQDSSSWYKVQTTLITAELYNAESKGMWTPQQANKSWGRKVRETGV